MPSCASVWYQTTETFPASPAATHGQKTRALPGWATATGDDHVAPRFLVETSMIEFGAGVAAPLQPPAVPACRLSVSQTTYTVPAESIAIAGQCAYIEVPRTPSCGVKAEPPAGIVLIPTPKLPSAWLKSAGSTSVPVCRSYWSLPNPVNEPPSGSEPLSGMPLALQLEPPSFETKTSCPLPLPSTVSVPMNTWSVLPPASQ